jgi:hypothetical protein
MYGHSSPLDSLRSVAHSLPKRGTRLSDPAPLHQTTGEARRRGRAVST